MTGASQFLAQLACILSHTTNNNDLELLPLLMIASNGAPGVFVEIGANDGYSDSATLVLERCLGWKGVLIEAQPEIFRLLQQSKRTAEKVHAAACTGSHVTMSGVRTLANGLLDETMTGVSGAVETMNARYKKIWGALLDLENVTRVPCKPLANIIRDAGFSSVDFISVDVQGAEYDVLASADPRMFKVILVEAEMVTPQKNELVRKLLKSTGHVRLNLTTVAKEKAGYNELYALPPLDVLDPRPTTGTQELQQLSRLLLKLVREKRVKQLGRLLDGWRSISTHRAH